MHLTPRAFLDAAVDIGVLSAEGVASFCKVRAIDPDQISLKDLARALADAGEMTRFQAEVVAQGKARLLVIGEYLVIEKIGEGGMGQVFKARHRRMKRIVAIKMLPRGATQSESLVRRFYREVEAAAKLDHPNIVPAYDAGEHHGTHHLVMAFVDGMDLAALLKQRGTLPVEQAVNVVVQAARGLAYAHAHGVIHRDIKPGNLLVDREGAVKILDMGLARIEQEPGTQHEQSLTMAGRLMGTVEYMAPEQAMDAKTADHRADIYALGCTLYRLITGTLPFKGENPMQTVVAHREQPAPLLGEMTDDVPIGLQQVFEGMVAKRVENRYESAKAMIDDLLAVCPAAAEALVRLNPEEHSTADQSVPGSDTLRKLAGAAPGRSKPVAAVSKAIPVARPAPKRRSAWWKSPAFIGGAMLAGMAVIVTAVMLNIGPKKPKPPAEVTERPAPPSAKNGAAKSGPAQTAASPMAPAAAPAPAKLSVTPEVEAALRGLLEIGVTFSSRAFVGHVSRMEDFTPEVMDDLLITFYKPATEADLAHLTALKGYSVRTLNLTKTGLDDEGLRRVAVFESVGTLILSGTKVTDVGLRHMAGLKAIRSLSLEGTAITDAGLEHLLGLQSLRTLKISETRVTGRGLDRLTALPLAALEIRGMSATISPADIARFKAAAPGCTVTADGPATPPADVSVIDLFQHVMLDADHVPKGRWTFEDGELTNAAGGASTIGFPVKLPESYRLEMEFTPPAGSIARITLGLFNAGNPCSLGFNLPGEEGEWSALRGLRSPNGRRISDSNNPTRVNGRLLEAGKRQRLTVNVTGDGVRVDLDGRKLIDWKGSPGEMGADGDPDGFVAKGWPNLLISSPVTVHRLSVTPVNAAAAPAP